MNGTNDQSDGPKNVEGHYYPEFDCGWGSCAEELFHYTSRYYSYTECFLRNLTGDRAFCMSGYSARALQGPQRLLMAGLLSQPPGAREADVIIQLVQAVIAGTAAVDTELLHEFEQHMAHLPRDVPLHYRASLKRPDRDDIEPLDPFLNLAERLGIPVKQVDHHLELPLSLLAEHLDSPSERIRSNLQDAILRLHNAGYLLRNHPGLTHREATDPDSN